MTDTRHPGLITPDNAPHLADLDDDTTPCPSQITIFCDNCGVENTADYLVPAGSTSEERYEIARAHLRRYGWHCSGAGDYCSNCGLMRTRYAIAEYSPILGDVWAERVRQIAKWGEQHREDGTPDGAATFNVEVARRRCQRLEAAGGANWAAVLTEEFCEAMAESDPAKLRAELVQVAAVCAAWIEDIDSRTAVS